jgi:hypothetical protein
MLHLFYTYEKKTKVKMYQSFNYNKKKNTTNTIQYEQCDKSKILVLFIILS